MKKFEAHRRSIKPNPKEQYVFVIDAVGKSSFAKYLLEKGSCVF